MMNEDAYANDFKEVRDLNLLQTQRNTRHINKSKFEYIMPLWAYKEIKIPNFKTKKLNASSLMRCRLSDSALHEVAW